MRPASPTVIPAVLLLLIVGSGLSACGRRGRLEPPPTPESIAAAEKAKEQSKSGVHKRPPNPPIRPPNQPFVLDPIL